MTTTNDASNDEIKALCVQVELLALLTGHLRSIYLEKDEVLDREFKKEEVAFTSSLKGIQAQHMSNFEHQIRSFLDPSSRPWAYQNLFRIVDDIMARTAGARQYFDRVTERFNRPAYIMLATVKVGDSASVEALLTETKECLNIVKHLNKLFI